MPSNSRSQHGDDGDARRCAALEGRSDEAEHGTADLTWSGGMTK